MIIYTIGFTKKSAQQFFSLIKKNNVKFLLDIRLNNVSQLAGFAKGDDLKFFLKYLCHCDYDHNVNFSPTKELLDDYRKKIITWADYEVGFDKIMSERKLADEFASKYSDKENVCLLCSEATPEQCHRRLVAEYLKKNLENIEIVHL